MPATVENTPYLHTDENLKELTSREMTSALEKWANRKKVWENIQVLLSNEDNKDLVTDLRNIAAHAINEVKKDSDYVAKLLSLEWTADGSKRWKQEYPNGGGAPSAKDRSIYGVLCLYDQVMYQEYRSNNYDGPTPSGWWKWRWLFHDAQFWLRNISDTWVDSIIVGEEKSDGEVEYDTTETVNGDEVEEKSEEKTQDKGEALSQETPKESSPQGKEDPVDQETKETTEKTETSEDEEQKGESATEEEKVDTSTEETEKIAPSVEVTEKDIKIVAFSLTQLQRLYNPSANLNPEKVWVERENGDKYAKVLDKQGNVALEVTLRPDGTGTISLDTATGTFDSIQQLQSDLGHIMDAKEFQQETSSWESESSENGDIGSSDVVDNATNDTEEQWEDRQENKLIEDHHEETPPTTTHIQKRDGEIVSPLAPKEIDPVNHDVVRDMDIVDNDFSVDSIPAVSDDAVEVDNTIEDYWLVRGSKEWLADKLEGKLEWMSLEQFSSYIEWQSISIDYSNPYNKKPLTINTTIPWVDNPVLRDKILSYIDRGDIRGMYQDIYGMHDNKDINPYLHYRPSDVINGLMLHAMSLRLWHTHDAVENKEQLDRMQVPADVRKVWKDYKKLKLHLLSENNWPNNFAIVSKTDFMMYLFLPDGTLVGKQNILVGKNPSDMQRLAGNTPSGKYKTNGFFNKPVFNGKYYDKWLGNYIKLWSLEDKFSNSQRNDAGIGVHELYDPNTRSRSLLDDVTRDPSVRNRKMISDGCINASNSPLDFGAIFTHLVPKSDIATCVYVTSVPDQNAVSHYYSMLESQADIAME